MVAGTVRGEAQTAAGGRAYVYELAWPAPGMGGVFGACHGLDVPLVFGTLDRGQPAMLIGEAPRRIWQGHTFAVLGLVDA